MERYGRSAVGSQTYCYEPILHKLGRADKKKVNHFWAAYLLC